MPFGIHDEAQNFAGKTPRDLISAVGRSLLGWRGIMALASIAIVAGLAFNWSWLVAAGIAPVLLSALPCVAMCALGLCMHPMGGRSCSTGTSPPPTPQGSEPKSQPERRLTDA